jgi:hypothetical protein
LDRLCIAQLRLLRLGYHCTIASLSFPALCDAYTTYATVTRLAPYHAPQAPQARIFPRLTRHSRVILTASVIYCHHQFTHSHHPEELPSVEYQVRALPLRKAQCSRASRAYVALFTRLDTSPSHHCSHHHYHASFRQLSASYPQAFVVFTCTRVTFAQSAILPRFHAPMAPYTCAFPRLSPSSRAIATPVSPHHSRFSHACITPVHHHISSSQLRLSTT